uniref:NYN domain-containing protein n=1 Tax=Noccaea caerulescens TaxID=107243 RepID=A0A1J3IFR2_NOCCA
MAEDLSNGEDVEDLSKFNDYSSRTTNVFWDVVRCPIPAKASLQSVRSTIRDALGEMGLYNCITLLAYGAKMSHSKDDLYAAGFIYRPEGDLAVHLISFSRTFSRQTLIVITEPDPESELHRVLKCLQSRQNDILVVNPKGQFIFDSVESVIGCTQDVDGGKPIIEGRRMEDTPLVITSLSSLASLFQGCERKGFVFWDVVEYPVPSFFIPNLASSIRSAFQRMGHDGCVEILAFGGDKLKLLTIDYFKDELHKAGIICIPHGFSEEALRLFAAPFRPRTLMIIPKPDPDSELHRVHTLLKQRNHHVLLVKPPGDKDSNEYETFLHHAPSIVRCTDSLYGGKPIIGGRRRTEDAHVIQDFSKRITFVKGGTVGVFWSLEDFPFPAGWSPDEIYKKIQSAFGAHGYESNMSIWAYVADDKEGDFLKYKTWKSSIYFLPGGGDKSARRNRMLHDIALWGSDVFTCSHGFPFPATLVIVSDKDKVRADKVFSHRLRMMIWHQYNVWFLTPTPTLKADDSNWLTSVSEDVYAFPE